MVCFHELGTIRSSMWIMTVIAGYLCLVVLTLKNVNPLLMMLPSVRLRVTPYTRLLLIIAVEGFAKFIRFIISIVPWKIKASARKAHTS